MSAYGPYLDDLECFSALLDRIYECALEPRHWPEVMERIAAWVNAKSALIHTPLHPDEQDGFRFAHGFLDGALDAYRTHYVRQDAWTQALMERDSLSEGSVILGSDLVPLETTRDSELFRECFGAQDLAHLMAGIVFDGNSPATIPTVCAFFRGQRQPGFEAGDLDRFRLLIPHLSRAVGVMLRLRESEQRAHASLAALDRISTGVILIAPPDRVVFVNRSAQKILERADGVHIEQRLRLGGRLAVSDPALQRNIDESIRRAIVGDVLEIAHFNRSLLVPRPSGGFPLTLQFSALPEQNEFDQGIIAPRAIVFIADTGRSTRVSQDRLIELFDLTHAEARLGQALADGDGLKMAANRLGISLNTAKTQLQAIYAKTQVNSRSKLVRLLATLAVQWTD